jgi:hypothetical protein
MPDFMDETVVNEFRDAVFQAQSVTRTRLESVLSEMSQRLAEFNVQD